MKKTQAKPFHFMRANIGRKDKVQINMLNMKEESFYVALLWCVHKTWTNAVTLTDPASIFCFFFFLP